MREAVQKRTHRIHGKTGMQPAFDIADPDMGTACHQPGARQAQSQGSRLRFQGISGRNQPPDIIQFQGAARDLADIEMAAMGGVEGTAQ